MKNLNVLGIIVVLILLTIRCNEDDRPVGVKNPPSITHVEKRSHDTELSVGDKDSLVFNVIVDEDVTATWSVVTNNQNVKFSATSGTLEEDDSTLIKISFTAVDEGRDTIEFSVIDSKENSSSVTYILSIKRETHPIITGLTDTIKIVQGEYFYTEGEIRSSYGLSKVDLLVDGLLVLELAKDFTEITKSYRISGNFIPGLQINFGLITIGIHTVTFRATDLEGNVAKKDIIVVVSSPLVEGPISITGLPDTIKIVQGEYFSTEGEIRSSYGLSKVDLLVDGLLVLELAKDFTEITKSYRISGNFIPGLQINFGLITIGIHTVTFSATDLEGNIAKKDIIVEVSSPLVEDPVSITGLPDVIKIVLGEYFYTEGEIQSFYGLSKVDLLVDGLLVLELAKDFTEITKSYRISGNFIPGLQINFGLTTIGIHTVTYSATDLEGNVAKKDIIVEVSSPLVEDPVSITGLPDVIKIVQGEYFYTEGEIQSFYGLSKVDLLVDGLLVLELAKDFTEITKSYRISGHFIPGLQINFGLTTIGIHTVTYSATDLEGNVAKKDIIVEVSSPLVEDLVSITGLADTIKIVIGEYFYTEGEIQSFYGLSKVDLLVDGLLVLELAKDFTEITKSYRISGNFIPGLQINFGLATVGIHTVTFSATDLEGNVAKKDIIVVVSPH